MERSLGAQQAAARGGGAVGGAAPVNSHNSSEILALLGGASNNNKRGPPATLDPSDFPTLGRASSTASSSGNSVASNINAAQLLQQQQQQQLLTTAALPPLSSSLGLYGLSRVDEARFALHKEDFPSLPQQPQQEQRGPLSHQQQQPQHLPSSVPVSFSRVVDSRASVPGSSQQPSAATTSSSSSSVLSSSMQSSATAGNYGLLGLMGVIRMEDPERGTWSLGTDLTTLGLNLNSNESLHSTFSSPWNEDPSQAEFVFSLPSSFPLQAIVRPEIMEKVSLETLFVCFYSMPREILQVLAAQELVNRSWRLHEEHRLWFSQGKNGSVVYFDAVLFERRVYTGRLPDGFESGFLSPEVVNATYRSALAQLANQQQKSASSALSHS